VCGLTATLPDCQQRSAENGRVEYGDGNGSKFRDNPIAALVESYTNHDLVCGGTGSWLALGPSWDFGVLMRQGSSFPRV
jgi:hypothetical protein